MNSLLVANATVTGWSRGEWNSKIALGLHVSVLFCLWYRLPNSLFIIPLQTALSNLDQQGYGLKYCTVANHIKDTNTFQQPMCEYLWKSWESIAKVEIKTRREMIPLRWCGLAEMMSDIQTWNIIWCGSGSYFNLTLRKLGVLLNDRLPRSIPLGFQPIKNIYFFRLFYCHLYWTLNSRTFHINLPRRGANVEKGRWY